ncbi:MAG: DNA methyltransferase [Anaerolineaceae bacterium]|nr:DNA methyltransferase [Anaerolineaceae bacterium]
MEDSFAALVDTVIQGNSLEVLKTLPDRSVDLVFADPPYNLQLQGELWRPNVSKVDAVDNDWDKFDTLQAYDEFTQAWLRECRRILKPSGSLWVIGSYHNIFRVGRILQDLGYWILNDVVWVKANPMPNFRGMRFTNAHETLIWAQPQKDARYTFNYHAMKALNEDLQMRSDWFLPICTGSERLKEDGQKVHPTQKPEALLYRVIMATTNPGDLVLDPFFGTGTTGAMARKLQRHYIGIELDEGYVRNARRRLSQAVQYVFNEPVFFTPEPRKLERIPFGVLVEQGFLHPGDTLFFGAESKAKATVQADGSLVCGTGRGSIHSIAREIKGGPANGWAVWLYWDAQTQSRQPIDKLRQEYRRQSAEK